MEGKVGAGRLLRTDTEFETNKDCLSCKVIGTRNVDDFAWRRMLEYLYI